MAIMEFIWKWLFCSWIHKKHRCYPEVDVVDSKFWHCTKCHPCSEELEKLGIIKKNDK